MNHQALIAAMQRHDRRVVGIYLRKRNNLFPSMYSRVSTPRFFQALQEAGAIRTDTDAGVVLHIIEILSYGQLTIGDFKPLDQFPPYDAVMEALADMMDRALRPEDAGTGANSEAQKAIVRQITPSARAQLEQIKQTRE